MNATEACVALNLLPNVGPIRVRQLLHHFGDPCSILAAPASLLGKVEGIGPQIAETIAGWERQVDLAAEMKAIADFGCSIVTQDEPLYPETLRQIYDPPILLYVKGTLEKRDKHSVAVVGSRLTTHYGINVARKLGFQLANSGLTVVSGGARGIDTAAHQGAIQAKGRTIAVLGTGINLVFPSENAELFDRVAQHGAVITQFPFNRKADKQTFPIRNRIVAGMTLGTLVVEANLTSGALITAGMAAEYGRQVFAIPGPIDSPRSKGCHDLIKKGAKLCEGIDDILSEFEYLFPPSNPSLATTKSDDEPATVAENAPSPSLTHQESVVLGVLEAEDLSVDEIIDRCGLPAPAVSVALLMLEMKRLARQAPGRLYRRAR